MREAKVLVSKNSLRMPKQCTAWAAPNQYKGSGKANWSRNTKRASKRSTVQIYRPNAAGEMRLVERV